MTLKEHLRKNIVLAVPVMVGQLGHIMVNVADSMMVGRVGVVPLAGATFAGAIYVLLLLFGIGVSYAITPLVAAEDPNNKSKLMQYLQDGLLMNTVLGIILSVVGFGMSYFLDYFGQDPEVAAQAKPYLRVMSASLVFVMIFQNFRQYAEGLSDTMSPMVVSVVANLLNILLNWVFIFGHWGFEPMGLYGAGLATFIARIPMVLLMIWFVRKKIAGFQWHFQTDGIKRMLKIGVPSGMQFIFEVGAFGGAGIMIGWIGPEAQAAHNIALNLSAISYMAATGIAAAASVRIGNQMGLKDKRNLRIAGFTSFGMAAAFMSLSALAFIIFRFKLPYFYVHDAEVVRMAAFLLIIGAAFQISDGLQAVGLGVLRGLRDVRVPTAVTFVAYWIIALPLGYVLGFPLGWGVNGVWVALSIGLTVAAILHIWRFNRLSGRLKF
jgi:MATE family multidrug resistance protein